MSVNFNPSLQLMNYRYLIILILIFFSSCAKLELISSNDNPPVEVSYQINSKTKQKQGYYREFIDGKLVRHCYYKKDKIEGIDRTYYTNGFVQSELTYKKGVLQGEFMYYFEENGKIKQRGSYEDGKIEGQLFTFFADSVLKEKIMYVNNYTEGPFTEFHPDGSLSAEGYYTFEEDYDELEHGPLKLYDSKGVLEKKMICKKGQCCTVWTSADGKVRASSKLCSSIIDSMRGWEPE